MMTHHAIELPEGISYGSQAGTAFATIINETSSGHEYRVTRQAQARRRFRLLKQLLTDEDVAELRAFQLGRRGSFHSFDLVDFTDYSTAADDVSAPSATDQILGTGDGSTDLFQLVKRYEVTGPNEYPDVLDRPIDGTVLVALDGTPTSSFTVNGQGQVLLSSPPANGVIVTAGCEFYRSARFASDILTVQADAHGLWSIQDFDCVQVLNEVAWPERWFAGGSKDWGSVSTSVQFSLADGELQLLTPTAAISGFLPIPNRMPGGPRMLRIAVAAGSSGTLQLRDDGGATLGSPLAAGDIAEVGLVVGASTSKWVVR